MRQVHEHDSATVPPEIRELLEETEELQRLYLRLQGAEHAREKCKQFIHVLRHLVAFRQHDNPADPSVQRRTLIEDATVYADSPWMHTPTLTTALLTNVLDAELESRKQLVGYAAFGGGVMPLDALAVIALGVAILLYVLFANDLFGLAWGVAAVGGIGGLGYLLARYWGWGKPGAIRSLQRIRHRIASGRYDHQAVLKEFRTIENQGILLPGPMYAILRQEPSRPTDSKVKTDNHSRGQEGGTHMALQLTSSAFEMNGEIPAKYTGEGKNISPQLSWTGAPEGANEFALICDDPDAPMEKPFVHWVAYKIPPHQTDLPENIKGGIVEGKNDFGRMGYGGPMPPKGHGVHHYHFRLYALDQPLQAGPGLSKDQLVEAMKGHILDEGELIGTYERK